MCFDPAAPSGSRDRCVGLCRTATSEQHGEQYEVYWVAYEWCLATPRTLFPGRVFGPLRLGVRAAFPGGEEAPKPGAVCNGPNSGR